MAIFWALVSDKHLKAASANFGDWQSSAASANQGDDLASQGEKTGLTGARGAKLELSMGWGEKNRFRRYFVTENEARANQYNGEKIERIELDEIEARQAAANWLNHCESMRARAIKREANKTAKERSDNMKKAWVTRRTKS